MNRTDRIHHFVAAIWQWYAHNKRTLPWRDLSDRDPVDRVYKVLVSEIMLQQTQVNRVKIVFKSFLEKFPRIANLTQASNRDVLLAWRGMGYNGRALRLRDAAKHITEKMRNVESGMIAKRSLRVPHFLRSMEELTTIPGIGPYTAAAIRNFAWNIPTPCLDTNIRRILHRTFVGPEHSDGTWERDDRYLLKLAEEVLNVAVDHREEGRLQIADCRSDLQSAMCDFPFSAANWHAALMDFGSMIQTKHNPQWDLCPLTAGGFMKTTPAQWKNISHSAFPGPRSLGEVGRIPHSRREPGRFVGTRYIPNRIFRGAVIEELRDASHGLTLDGIGKRACIDWSPKAHRTWLQGIVEKLVRERMLHMHKGKYRLYEGI